MLKLYNTLTRKKETFKPLNGKKVGFYSCGPTVYDYSHIGNFRAYLVSDVLKRYLQHQGFQVKHVMNLTDVDDKTIKRSQKERVTLKELTNKYNKAFFKDLDKLGIRKADVFPKATEHIKEMTQIIQKLLDKKYAYAGEDGSIYYSISKLKNYGKLSHIKLKNLKEGARIKSDEYEKEQAKDFALWKAWDKKDGKVFWNISLKIKSKTKTFKGRPGWHIECSAMSIKHLGKSFDIHAGGVDLIFPHHENEIAQSEGATGQPFVKYWVHNGWLLVNGKKMSKSLGNFYTLRDLIKKGYDPRAIKLGLLAGNYRHQLDFTFGGLDAAKARIERIDNFVSRLKDLIKNKEEGGKIKDTQITIQKAEEHFSKAMDDDLDIPKAFEIFFRFIREANIIIDKGFISYKEAKEMLEFVGVFDSIFGVLIKQKTNIPKDIKDLVKKREKAREDKDWKKSDKIRDKLKNKGWGVDDTPEGAKIRRL